MTPPSYGFYSCTQNFELGMRNGNAKIILKACLYIPIWVIKLHKRTNPFHDFLRKTPKWSFSSVVRKTPKRSLVLFVRKTPTETTNFEGTKNSEIQIFAYFSRYSHQNRTRERATCRNSANFSFQEVSTLFWVRIKSRRFRETPIFCFFLL